MARESFADSEVAEVLNSYFISIKVDREERPDIDNIYMKACQVMGKQGGWPLSVFMTPDKKPFFAGTYYPRNRRQGMPGFIDVLLSIAGSWSDSNEAVIKTGDRVTSGLNRKTPPGRGLTPRLIDAAYEECSKRFDPRFGGFGDAPKFPEPHVLLFLLRYHQLRNVGSKALLMVIKTLDYMACGGFYDVVGHGFCRYSTDREWASPHFEKMLYDNALLAIAYTAAYSETGLRRYRDMAKNTLSYMTDRLADPAGGFYAAEGAESQGVEGKYYFFTKNEIISLLGETDGNLFCSRWNIGETESIPHGLPLSETDDALLKKYRSVLYEARNKRVPPLRDEKILLGWNGLAIGAYSLAGRIVQSPEYIDVACKTVERIERDMKREDGRMFLRHIDGSSSITAYHDDYAFYLYGLIMLYDATQDKNILDLAEEKAAAMIELFWDKEYGGFYQSGNDAEEQILNPKEACDHAMPSGNAVAADSLLRLAALTHNNAYKEKAETVFKVFGEDVYALPLGHTHLLSAYIGICPRGASLSPRAGNASV